MPKQGHIRQSDGEFFRVVAHCNERPEQIALLQSNPLPLRSNIAAAQAFLECKPIHVLDTQVDALGFEVLARQTGVRTLLAVPLLREGTGIGTITIWRDFIEPFTERQIELVKTFADQAVIAIENVRLFNELQDRNRDLTEALEQQTATSEILRVIASSPTDIQPVLDTVIANAVRLVGAKQGHIRQVDGEFLRLSAHYNESDENVASFRARPVRVNSEGFCWSRASRKTTHPCTGCASGKRQVSTSWEERQEREPCSLCHFYAKEQALERSRSGVTMLNPSQTRQIDLVKTFADQAVIAIENVRLFQELEEA